MKFRNNLKRFFTLDRHHAEGFTLVELIVVIAILAILAGVAVPAYSGYVTRANKQADVTLVGEVVHALTLAYYSGELEEGYVIISSVDGTAPNYDGNAAIDEAMKKTFGDNWANMMTLSYDGWVGVDSDKTFADAYRASSYNGNEDALVAQLGNTTNALKEALAKNPDLIGDGFSNYLTTNKVNKNNNQAVSNAAILYAADNISKMDTDTEAAVNVAFQTFFTSGNPDVITLTTTLKEELGAFGAVAAIYAQGEAFGQYVASSGDSSLLDSFHKIDPNVADTNAALDQIGQNLFGMVDKAQTDYSDFANKYITAKQFGADMKAYMESMKKIAANSDLFSGRLGDAGCYTDGTADAVLKAAVSAGSLGIDCKNGEVAVWIEDGVVYNTLIGIQD